LIEIGCFWNILGQIHKASYEYVTVAAKISNRGGFCAFENFACWNLNMENYIWVYSKFGHLNRLSSVLGESVQNPAFFKAVFKLDAHLKHVD
jgi:hypothetical protein